jgi:hypothetical protein
MANFLITTANTLAQGTSTADTFYFNTARGVSIQGSDGNDVLTAGTANLTATNALLAGNAGNDTINLLSSFNTNQGSIFGGAGADLISASQFSAVDTTIQGGGANDTITLASAVFDRGNVGLNAGNDSLVASASAVFNSATVALGGGTDTFTAAYVSAVGSTINGGGGADTINIDGGSLFGGQVNGDVLGDDTFFGNDTITFNGAAIGGGATINAGLGNDLISAGTVAGALSTAFINGNQGDDVITANGFGSGAASAFIGGGAGNDTISVGQDAQNTLGANVTSISFGTVMGGGGDDTITYSSNLTGAAFANNNLGTTGGFIQGGLGADSISFNGDNSGGIATLLYADAAESNATSFDTVSSNANLTGTDVLVFNLGRIHSADTRVSAAGTINGGEVYTAIDGMVTFTGSFSDNIKDQVSALDVNTNQNGGAVALFSKGTSSTTYLFMQGGSAGVSDDLVVKVNAAHSGAFIAINTIGNGSAVSIDLGAG